jgi:hypothetical protein
MKAPVSRPADCALRQGRLWWLPADGLGNGLDDDAWAPVLEVSPQIMAALLWVLRQAGVPAYAAPARSVGARLRDDTRWPAGYQLWVGASAYGEAEKALLTAMPYLARETARHGDSAWR